MLTPSMGRCLMPSIVSGAGMPVASRLVGTMSPVVQHNERGHQLRRPHMTIQLDANANASLTGNLKVAYCHYGFGLQSIGRREPQGTPRPLARRQWPNAEPAMRAACHDSTGGEQAPDDP